jgi:PTS system nitrogen regulatory IIA component
MSEDYDIDGLAAYLHLDPVAVRKMAERGKLPGRRVAGEWRFSAAEVHHWLEERILGSDEAEQARLEGVLRRRARKAGDEEVTLDALLPPEAVAVPLAARTKASVVSEMVVVAARTGWLWDPVKMEEAVRQREELYPTAVPGGLALLHPRRPMAGILGAPFVAFGRTTRGIPFGDPGGGLTDLFFLILSMDDGGHLRALARLSRVLGDAGVLAALREAQDAAVARDVLIEGERRLSI